MPVFISYSRMDGSAVQDLLRDFEKMDLHVWMDGNLRGGDAWWNEILRQIRESEVFVFALSDHSMHSKPCRAEFDYARALGVPILPVQVGTVSGMRTGPFADIQVVDYRKRDSTAAMELFSAVQRASAATRPPADPSIPLPPVPFAYLMRLRTEIDAPDLPADVQDRISSELVRALTEEEAGVRPDIVELMRALRARPDVSLRVARVVDQALAPVAAPAGAGGSPGGAAGLPPRPAGGGSPPGGPGPRPAGGPIPVQRSGPPPGPQYPPGGSTWPGPGAPRKRSNTPLVIACIALLVVAGAVGIVLATTGGNSGGGSSSWTADARTVCQHADADMQSAADGGSLPASTAATKLFAMDQSLRNVDAPADKKPRVELMTQAWDSAATDIQRIVTDNQSGDSAAASDDQATAAADIAKGNQIADDLGLSVCAGVGSGVTLDPAN